MPVVRDACFSVTAGVPIASARLIADEAGGVQRRKNRAKNHRARRPRPTPMTLSEFSKMALALIEHHEGRRAFPYYDSVGKISIGIGRNLADRGLSNDEISLLFLNDMRLCRQICDRLFVNFDCIDPTRQAALLSMAFNLGVPRLGKFITCAPPLRRMTGGWPRPRRWTAN